MPTTPTTTTAAISDSRFNALKAKLRELFELDKADLDFGIYRIMAAKNREVTDFLDRQLKDVVTQTLAAHGANAVDDLDQKIAAARKGASDAGFNPDDSPKVQELEAARASAGGASARELEADIYNHLLAFFGRYYDEGDFISQRRYAGDKYAIPYSGEEVVLHWANKDQYYIKSGEWHKDYRFKLADGRRVRFALVDATQEAGNNKEPDEAKRRYILVDDNPVSVEGDTLTLRFHFRAPTDAEKARADDKAVAIFGGKYETSTKGDERERFCADAEKRAIHHIPAPWAAAVLALSPTDSKPARTLLGKHLDAFTARNTFDYFIHKDLGGFLRRELDFYIKNEVVRLDDLDAAPADHLQRVQGRVRAIRRVASKVVDLLESLENFQKRLWLKKKFVLNTSWLVTVDRVPERLRDTVANNAEQWAEWERLGFKPEGDAAGGLFGGAEWGTRAYLDACDKLVVDTRLFDEAFTAELLASEEAVGGKKSVDDSLTARLVSGENFGSLRILRETLEASVDCIYIDPPYNTGESEFPYKDGYKHSSWASLYFDRAVVASTLLHSNSSFLCSLDDTEDSLLRACMSAVRSVSRLGEYIWKTRNTDNRIVTRFSMDHEQIHLWAAGAISGRIIDRSSYENPDNDPRGPYTTDPLTGKANSDSRPNLHYTITNPETGDVYPPDPDFGWITEPEGFAALLRDNRVYWPKNPKTGKPRKKRFSSEMDDRAPASSLGVSITQGDGNDAVIALFGEKRFAFPKAPMAISAVLDWSTHSTSFVLDYFAGSGTTGECVLRLNREDHGYRRFALIEMGTYFETVVRPRISKVVYSPNWDNGKAKSHDAGLSALVKCFAVESYEDALNNLPAPTGGMFDGRPDEEADALIHYALDLELGPHLLDLDIFRDPWGHAINAQLAGDDEIKRHRVDLVETFNYLLGLRVIAYGPIERYSAKFERAEHDDGLGRLKLTGRLRRDADGPFKFQRVEGILNDGHDTRVLVVWRRLTEDSEQDAAVLDAWMARHREATTERTEHRDYHLIYINGPVTLPQPTAEIRTVYPIEEVFKAKMFEDTDGAAND